MFREKSAESTTPLTKRKWSGSRSAHLFWSSKEGKNTTLAAYKDRMPEDQPFYYYACGESVEKIAKLPQVERILDKGYEILYCTEDVDDFVMKGLREMDGKPPG